VQGMKIRSYHSDSVESAIRQARLELGGEAVLLDSKQTDAPERHLGLYEVRFGFTGTSAPPRRAQPADTKVAEIHDGIEEIKRILYGQQQTHQLPPPEFSSQPLLADLYNRLVDQDLSPALSARLVSGAVVKLSERAGCENADPAGLDIDRWNEAVAEQVRALAPVAAARSLQADQRRALALVGPCGAGKSTTLAKLAIQLGLQRGLRVHLLSADVYRIAAVEQLQTYAGILGAGWTVAQDAGELAAAIDLFFEELSPENSMHFPQQLGQDSHRAGVETSGLGDHRPAPEPAWGAASAQAAEQPLSQLLLVDTPGYGPAGRNQAIEFAGLFGDRPDVEVHLVVSASTKPRDLRQITEKYRIFHPSRLLFTKLDETLSFGPLLEEAVRTKWPVSFLGIGASIPEDLIPATPDVLADLIVGRRPVNRRLPEEGPSRNGPVAGG